MQKYFITHSAGPFLLLSVFQISIESWSPPWRWLFPWVLPPLPSLSFFLKESYIIITEVCSLNSSEADQADPLQHSSESKTRKWSDLRFFSVSSISVLVIGTVSQWRILVWPNIVWNHNLFTSPWYIFFHTFDSGQKWKNWKIFW